MHNGRFISELGFKGTVCYFQRPLLSVRLTATVKHATRIHEWFPNPHEGGALWMKHAVMFLFRDWITLQ